jgi:hypothetical protein
MPDFATPSSSCRSGGSFLGACRLAVDIALLEKQGVLADVLDL